jgi:hypothetical protein
MASNDAKAQADATPKAEPVAKSVAPAPKEGVDKVAKGFEEAAAFNQGNVDAMVKTGEIAAKAAEDLNAEVVAFAKRAMDQSVAAARDLSGAKSVTDFVEKQAAFTKVSVEGFVQQAARINELYFTAAKHMAEPLNARVTAAAEALKTYRA